MTIEQAIKKAIEGGYTDVFRDGCKDCDGVGTDDNIDFICTVCKGTGDGELLLEEMAGQWERFTSDPLFWQSLGKAMWWEGEKEGVGEISNGECMKCRKYCKPDHHCKYIIPAQWVKEWHRFIDHLADGDTPESFFETL